MKLTSRVHFPFYQVEPVIFGTKDQRIHQHKKRKVLSPDFATRNLNEYETYLTEQIGKLMGCFDRCTELSGQVQLDLNEYCELTE
jgi:hypothetical protein